MDTLVVTGHRPDKLGGYGWNIFSKLVGVAMEQIRHEKPDMVVSGMALGWDLACAIATIRLRDEKHMNIRLRCVIPFASQYTKWRDEKAVFLWTKALCKTDEVMLLRRGAPTSTTQAIFWLDEHQSGTDHRQQNGSHYQDQHNRRHVFGALAARTARHDHNNQCNHPYP